MQPFDHGKSIGCIVQVVGVYRGVGLNGKHHIIVGRQRTSLGKKGIALRRGVRRVQAAVLGQPNTRLGQLMVWANWNASAV